MKDTGKEVGTTIIEPVSSRFTKVATILDYKEEGTLDGEGYVRNLPTRSLKRFPGSRQGLMPEFNGKLGKFKIVKEDGTLWEQKDLDELVEKVPIAYEDYNAPNKGMVGTLITKANIKDWRDPYLGSHQWKVNLYEGERTLKDSKFLEDVYSDIMRGRRNVGIENEEGTMAGDVEYVIKRPTLAKEKAVKSRDLTLTANDLYRAMQTDRKRLVGILRLFNVDINKDTDIGELQDSVWEKAADTVTTYGGHSYQKLFVHYASLEEVDFRLRELISLGTNRSVIRAKGGMYYFDEIVVGSTYEDMLEYFKNSNNSARLDALKILLEENK